MPSSLIVEPKTNISGVGEGNVYADRRDAVSERPSAREKE